MSAPEIGSRVRANVPGWPNLHGREGVVVAVDKTVPFPIEVQCDGHETSTRFLEDEVEPETVVGCVQ